MSLFKSKKAEVEDIVIRIGVVLGILILVFWFVFFMGKQTINTQNLVFENTNKFVSYYTLILNSDEAKISGVEIESLENSILIINKNKVCIKVEDIINFCQKVISNTTYINSFNLSEKNYFTFEKNNLGVVSIKKTY